MFSGGCWRALEALDTTKPGGANGVVSISYGVSYLIRHLALSFGFRVFRKYDECEMVCAEKMRLLHGYSVATSASFIANTKLQLKTGLEFRTALMLSVQARAECAKARLAFQDHTAEHHC